MKKSYFYILSILITLIGAYLRIVKLDNIPPHLGNDEISIAYDSYSIRKIGKDEHGNKWPLSFESHRTYKAPLYAYLNIPINWCLGNNEYGVRLLSALSGVLLIIEAAVIGKYLGGNLVGLAAAILMAFNPKEIFVSRIAFESNLAAAMLGLGVMFMFCFKDNKKKMMAVLAGIFLGLSIWGYHTEWGLTPMLAIILPFLTRKKIDIKSWWLMWLVMILIALPIFYDFVKIQSADTNNRASTQLWYSSGQFKDYLRESPDGILKKSATFFLTPINNYLEHLNFDSLFSSGGDIFNGESPLESGWFLLGCLPLLIIGFINIKKVFNENWLWIFVWWLLCPIVPAMTAGGVSSVRNLAFILPSILIMAGGAWILWKQHKKYFLLEIIILSINFFIFILAYFIHFQKDSGNNFQYGYKEAWEYVKPVIHDYDRVVVENRFGQFGQFIGVPHLYFGYFEAFSPEEMQDRVDGDGVRIGKYEFRYVDWNIEKTTKKTIYIVSAINPKVGSFYETLKEVKLVRNLDDQPQFIIYETVDK